MSTNIPQHILDAIHQVAEYARQTGYGEVLISGTGDASFRPGKPKEESKPRKFSLVTAVHLSSMLILLLGYLIVSGTAVFGVFRLDFEWWLVLTGTNLLFGTTIMNSAATLERRPRPHSTLLESLLIAVGLAALSNRKPPILFGFF